MYIYWPLVIPSKTKVVFQMQVNKSTYILAEVAFSKCNECIHCLKMGPNKRIVVLQAQLLKIRAPMMAGMDVMDSVSINTDILVSTTDILDISDWYFCNYPGYPYFHVNLVKKPFEDILRQNVTNLLQNSHWQLKQGLYAQNKNIIAR